MDKVKQIYNFSDEATLNSAEIIFKVIDDTTNPVIDFEQRNIDRNTVEIWTGTGSTGTKLIESTDYDFTRSNDAASASTEKFIVNGITIINPSYYDTDLYIPVGTLSGYGDVIDETDVNRLQDQFTGLQAGFNFIDGDCSTLSVIEQYSTYNDGAVSVPVDGEGGTATLLTLSLETSSPLIGSGSLLLTKGSGDAQGQGMSSRDFTIDEGVRGKQTQLKFTYKTSANYASGDMGMYLYDIDNSTLLYPSVVDMPTADNAGDFFATFITTLTGGNYRLIWHVRTVNSLAYSMLVDKIEVGEFNYALGDVGRWKEYWVGSANPSDTTDMFGNTWENGLYKISVDRSGTGAGIITFILDIDIDITSSGGAPTWWVSSTTAIRLQWNATNGNFDLVPTGGTYAGAVITKIEKWIEAKNINLATDFTEYASNDGSGGTSAGATYDTGMQYGMGGSNFVAVNSSTGGGSGTKYKLAYNRPIQSTDAFLFEIYSADNDRWTSLAESEFAQGYMFQGGSAYGAHINVIGTLERNEAYVEFANTGRLSNGGTYGSAGASWGDLTGYKWRVRKVSNGNMAEVPRMVRAEYNQIGLVVADQPIDYPNKIEDTHDAVTTGTTWKFTAPIDGIYLVNSTCQVSGDTLVYSFSIYKNNARYKYTGKVKGFSVTGFVDAGSVTIRLVKGDYIDVRSSQNSNAVSAVGEAYHITIERIGD